jgi:dTDP-4-amino-4,6-dideoxygalactose transaminase
MTMDAAVKVPFVDLRAQYATIREEVTATLAQVLDHAAFIFGPEVARFEEQFADFQGVNHVVGVGNGTDALVLALRALGIGPGDDVVIPANTFAATAEAVIHAGARPVLVDVDLQTYNIDVHQIERRITPSTKAIVPVHLYGQPADLGPILAIAKDHGLSVVEDAAQAHGAQYRGRKVGSWGDAAVFSFYPAKNLGAYGDAGAVATNNDQVELIVRKLRDHGGTTRYQHDLVGYNSRLDTLQAGVLLVKLKHLDEWNQRRQENAQIYNTLLSAIPGISIPVVLEEAAHVYHLYVIRVQRGSRDDLRRHLQAHGIQTGIHYPQPLHLTPSLKDLRYHETQFPVAERCAREILSLPMYPELERSQIRYVAEQILNYMTASA